AVVAQQAFHVGRIALVANAVAVRLVAINAKLLVGRGAGGRRSLQAAQQPDAARQLLAQLQVDVGAHRVDFVVVAGVVAVDVAGFEQARLIQVLHTHEVLREGIAAAGAKSIAVELGRFLEY
nr:hypothetical protein [Tanacetum cinerariifolium]